MTGKQQDIYIYWSGGFCRAECSGFSSILIIWYCLGSKWNISINAMGPHSKDIVNWYPSRMHTWWGSGCPFTILDIFLHGAFRTCAQARWRWAFWIPALCCFSLCLVCNGTNKPSDAGFSDVHLVRHENGEGLMTILRRKLKVCSLEVNKGNICSLSHSPE